jgi:hypothetical protein
VTKEDLEIILLVAGALYAALLAFGWWRGYL